MKDFVNKSMWVNILSSGLFFVLGLVMLLNATSAIEWFTLAIEVLLIVCGMATVVTYLRSDKKYDMFSYHFVYGVVSIVIAVFLIINPKILVSIIPLVIGLWMTIGSLIRVKFSFSLKDDKFGIIYLAGSLIMFTCGIAIMFNPYTIAIGLVKILGILLAVYSLTDIAQSIIFKNHIDKLDI